MRRCRAHGGAGSSKQHLRRFGRRSGRVGSIREPLSRLALRRARLRPRPRSPAKQGRVNVDMQQGPRVAVIGLDCATPKLLFGDLAVGSPEHLQADVPGDVRGSRQHHSADHRARLGLRHDRQDPGGARHLRFPEPQGHELRRARDRALRARSRRRRCGTPSGRRASPRSSSVSRRASRRRRSSPGWRVGCFLTPPSAEHYAYPAGARSRDRRGAGREGRVHLRHPELPPAGDGVRPRSGLQDDRTALQGGAAAREGQALGLLHDGRDGHGQAPPRVLALRRSGASAVPGRATLSRTRSSATTGRSTTRSAHCWSCFPRMRSRS